jgi:TrmH family RNA methyltransferase
MPVRIVQSKQNARLKELRRALAYPGRKAEGLVGVEGPHLVEEALRAGLRIKCIFAGDGMQHHVQMMPLSPEVEVLIMPWGILAGNLSTETPQPVAALVEMPGWTWEQVLDSRKRPPLVIVLAGIQDPGNLGTILRSAEAFGATGIVALPGTVSPWNPKAVRASAGSVFRMPLVAVAPRECFTALRGAGTRIFATSVRGAEPIHQANLSGPAAFLIGSEGSGVPEEIAAHADATLTIPCPGPVESLNAAVAASILLYEASRQRSSSRAGAVKRRSR